MLRQKSKTLTLSSPKAGWTMNRTLSLTRMLRNQRTGGQTEPRGHLRALLLEGRISVVEMIVCRDEEMDGEWEAPQIPNPACETAPGCGKWKRPMINNLEYKGKWKAPLVDNPNYQVSWSELDFLGLRFQAASFETSQKRSFRSRKGAWKPRKISNPDYFEDLQPFKMTPIKALGLELWSMTSDIYFDNFIVTSQKEVADRWASDSWGLKKLVASANEVSLVLSPRACVATAS